MLPDIPNDLSSHSLRDLAYIALHDFDNRGAYAAKPYMSAMTQLETLNDSYGFDQAHSIVSYFLANAGTWRGPTARAVKAELKKRLST